MKGELKYITHKEAVDFLLPRHYSGRIPKVNMSKSVPSPIKVNKLAVDCGCIETDGGGFAFCKKHLKALENAILTGK